ncbi:hypothetical protein JW859_00320 [bacterium]|nr:hypothetical protein [bacterium]
MEVWALIRVVSLGYLLGLATLSLASLLLAILRPRLAPAVRAETAFFILSGAFLLNSLLAVTIYLGVVNDRIQMTTPYFHRLMYGGWGAAIVTAGAITLATSLILAWLHWRRGRIPDHTRSPATIRHGKYTLRATETIPTISLVGVWRPEIWANPVYWEQLDDFQRDMALAHENCHRHRRDNLHRLLIMYIGGLYAILPWARRWARTYELDCELAVDNKCRQNCDARAYFSLVMHATGFALKWESPAVASHLSYAEQSLRLKELVKPCGWCSIIPARILGAVVAVLSVVPAAAMLLNPVSRCLCACYLGY